MNAFTAPFCEGNTRIAAQKNIYCGTKIKHTHIYKICTCKFCVVASAKGKRERIYEVTLNN